jgi:ribosome recycling factor
MQQDIIDDAKARMQKSVDALNLTLSKLRMGRATPSLLEQIQVDYYGTPTPLSQVANIGVEDARTLTVKPWEKTMVQPIEKAILTSDLGLNPATTGELIRVPLPALTEETRRELVKVVKAECENSKIAVRNIRRDANQDLKELEKEKEMSEDELRKAVDQVQKITDGVVADVDAVYSRKETELLEV